MDARSTALKVIIEVLEGGAYANIALAREINRGRFDDRDRRLATELVYGVVKAGLTLDWMLGNYLSRPLDKLDPAVRNILRLGLYQLFFLSRIPPSAAVNTAVDLAKKHSHAGSVKFVNAVLRAAVREPARAAYPDREADPVRYLSLRHFHPEWIVRRWVERMGTDGAESLCAANNETPPLSVRTNTRRTTREDLLAALTSEGVRCEPSEWAPEGVVCREFPALASLDSLRRGLFQVQDESSMTVAHVLAPRPGEFVIDACGAPGGKATHIAALMEDRGRVLSVDLYPHKLALTMDNARRLGLKCIETLAMDAVRLGEIHPRQADRVLVDAPCSGFGVIRRKPDSRWRKTESVLTDLPPLQGAILAGAAGCVRPGGVLVYSTCTTEPEENEAVVGAFLAENPDFVQEAAGDWLPRQRPGQATVQLWPHIDAVDGFFVARMRRKD